MIKLKHEIREPLHGFIKVSSDEREILDSFPLQRLRDIHQLALTYLLYPSATLKWMEENKKRVLEEVKEEAEDG